MKQKIMESYNIANINITTIGNDYLFEYDEKKYIYFKLNREVNMNNVLEMSNYLFNKSNIKSNKLIYNKKMELITDGYCLQEVNNFHNSIDIINILDFQKAKILNKNAFYWNEKWIIKVDYLENLVFNSILPQEYYYFYNIIIGLCENAIAYFNLIDLNSINIKVVSHYRIDNSKYSFFNPVNYIYDYEQRDIIEFIKLKLINKLNVIDDINYLIKVKKWNKNEWQLAICRLLYPSYHIDDLIQNIKNKNKKSHLLEINDYLNNIGYIISYVKKFVNIEEVRWLKEIIVED